MNRRDGRRFRPHQHAYLMPHSLERLMSYLASGFPQAGSDSTCPF